MKKIIQLLLIFLCIYTNLSAQENTKTKALIIETGLNNLHLLDSRLTSNATNDLGFHVAIHAEKNRGIRTNKTTLEFGQNIFVKKDLAYFKHLNWLYRYTHLRTLPNKMMQVGGFIDNGGIFSIAKGEWSPNNRVSYTFWTASGIAVQGIKNISINNKKFLLSYEASMPLLAYAIRPAYGHPYFESYLEDGTFNFTREGMWKAFFTSGKLRSLDSFMNFKTRVGLAMPIGKKANTIGVQYGWEYFYVGNNRPIRQAQHRVALIFKITL